MSHIKNEFLAHSTDTANPHGTDVENLGSGTLAELNAAITDATLDDSGDSRTPTAHAASHIDGGSDVIDGDKAEITWTPTNYTRTTSPTEVDALDQLTAHLAGIDAFLATVTSDGGSLILQIITTSSASYTVLGDDYTILADSTSNVVDVALPSAASSDGRVLHVKKIAGGNDVTINPDAAELIDGSATATISVINDSLKMQCDGTAWFII